MSSELSHSTSKQWIVRYLVVATSAVILSGCDNPVVPQLVPVLPPRIFLEMKGSILDDGAVHVIRKEDQFKVTPNTLFCDAEIDSGVKVSGWPHGRFGIDGPPLSDMLQGLGQNRNRRGRQRQRTLSDEECGQEQSSIRYSGQILNNRSFRPYKLVLAVWQGDPSGGGAVWIGGGGTRRRYHS